VRELLGKKGFSEIKNKLIKVENIPAFLTLDAAKVSGKMTS
jgi:hypothetical protein